MTSARVDALTTLGIRASLLSTVTPVTLGVTFANRRSVLIFADDQARLARRRRRGRAGPSRAALRALVLARGVVVWCLCVRLAGAAPDLIQPGQVA